MSKLSGWLFLSAFLGVVGFFMPWFEPVHPDVAVTSSWNAWDSDFGFVPGIVTLLAIALALMLRVEASGRTSLDSDSVGTLMDRFLWVPVLGLVACVWSWVRLPHEDVLQTCFGRICGGDTSSWVDDPGASRGTQFGFWLSVISCVIALLCAIALFSMREQIAEKLVGNRHPEDTAPRQSALRPTVSRNAVPMSQTGAPPAPAASVGTPVIAAPAIAMGDSDPTKPGWYRRHDDPKTLRRWHDGKHWTSITQDDAPPQDAAAGRADRSAAAAPPIAVGDPDPTRPGWYHRFDDAPAMNRWHDGKYWTAITRLEGE